MPHITYRDPNGRTHVVEVAVGLTVMEGARDNDIPGILADCGGACACSTCHVYVDPAWVEKLPAKDDMEEDMLDFGYDVRPNSRLSSCAVRASSCSSLIPASFRRVHRGEGGASIPHQFGFVGRAPFRVPCTAGESDEPAHDAFQSRHPLIPRLRGTGEVGATRNRALPSPREGRFRARGLM